MPMSLGPWPSYAFSTGGVPVDSRHDPRTKVKQAVPVEAARRRTQVARSPLQLYLSMCRAAYGRTSHFCACIVTLDKGAHYIWTCAATVRTLTTTVGGPLQL
jgi:hypothetical protein